MGAPDQSLDTASRAREYLTFRLGQEEYGIDILRVQEIRSYEQPTRIANAPAHVKGVINLRGVIVPIVDLRLRFNTAQCDYNDFTVVVVLHVAGRVVGAVVDPPCTGDDVRGRRQLHRRAGQPVRTAVDPARHREADDGPGHGSGRLTAYMTRRHA
jgi:hypothetical protein